MTRAVSKRLTSGHYEVSVGDRRIGEVVRVGPNNPKSPWEARSEGWVAETEKKREALAALLGHVIGRNGHTAEEALAQAIAYAGSDVPEPHVPVPKPPLGRIRELASEGDQERFTYLAWEEVKDRLALTRGLVLDMTQRRDVYMTLDSTTERLLKSIASSLYSAHQAMRRLDGEGE